MRFVENYPPIKFHKKKVKRITQNQKGLKCPHCYENSIPEFWGGNEPPICKYCGESAWEKEE